MKHAALSLLLTVLFVFAAGADEVDGLAARLKPAARFIGHRASFRAETNRFVFQQANDKVEEKDWRVVRDGDIILLALTPAAASTNLGSSSRKSRRTVPSTRRSMTRRCRRARGRASARTR